jgi:hypothetical protein
MITTSASIEASLIPAGSPNFAAKNFKNNFLLQIRSIGYLLDLLTIIIIVSNYRQVGKNFKKQIDGFVGKPKSFFKKILYQKGKFDNLRSWFFEDLNTTVINEEFFPYAGKRLITTLILLIVMYSFVLLGLFLKNYFLKDIQDYYINLISRPLPITYIPTNFNIVDKEKYFTYKYKNQFYLSKKKLERIFSLFKLAEYLTTNEHLNEGFVLLSRGPPGTGKTEFSKDLLRTTNGGYIIKLSELLFLGSKATTILTDMFQRAETEDRWIVLDDGDLGFLNRDKLSEMKTKNENIKKQVNSMLVFILGILGSKRKLKLIITTNILDFDKASTASLDQAVPRRIDYVLSLINPDTQERLHMWQNYFKGYEFDHNNSQEMFEIFAKLSENFSARDIGIITRSIKKLTNAKFANKAGKFVPYKDVLGVINTYKKRIESQKQSVLSEEFSNFMKRFASYNQF